MTYDRFPHLRLVHHALGLKLALDVGDLDDAWAKADDLLDVLAAAETNLTKLTARRAKENHR